MSRATRKKPDNMNNVFFKHHDKVYCLHQFCGARSFALSDVAINEILHTGPMTGLVACLFGLDGGREEKSTDREEKSTKRIEVHHIISGTVTKGWLHTHGMAEIGLPELEVWEVPSFLAEAAARLLQTVCRYMQEPGVVVRVGETRNSPSSSRRLSSSANRAAHVRTQIVRTASSVEKCTCWRRWTTNPLPGYRSGESGEAVCS